MDENPKLKASEEALSKTSNRPHIEKEIYEYNPESIFQDYPDGDDGTILSAKTRVASSGLISNYRGLIGEVVEDFSEPKSAYKAFQTTEKTRLDSDGVIENFYTPGSNRSSFEIRAKPRKDLFGELPATRDYRKGLLRSERAGFDLSKESNIEQNFGISQFETPFDRLRRLKIELQELRDYIESSIHAYPGTEKSSEEKNINQEHSKDLTASESNLLFGRDPNILLLEIESLQYQLKSISDDPHISRIFAVDPISTKKSGYHDIKKSIEKFSIVTKENEDFSMSSGPNENISYEMYCVPSLKPLVETSRVTTLENRLSEIEKKIGMHKASLLPFPDLRTAINSISKRLNMFNPEEIEALSKRMHALSLELQAVYTRHRELFDGSSGNQHVDYLYELCSGWKQLASSLPLIITRLKVLKGLHQEAGGVAIRLNVLESQQNELEKLQNSIAVSHDTLKVTMADNIDWAKRTIEALDRRFTKVAME